MYKNICVLSTALSLCLLSAQANACMDHYFYEQGNQAGLFSGSRAMSRMKRPSAQEKVFRLKHAPATVVIIDKDANLKIDYDLPPESLNVSLRFSTNNNVEMLDQDIVLNGLNGTANARFRVKKTGIDTITVTVSGEHEGQFLSYSSKIYINAKPATPS